MLLREFTFDDHIIRLIQNEDTYLAQIINSLGEKIFHREYNEYDKIRPYFDEIVRNIEQGTCNINDIQGILAKSII